MLAEGTVIAGRFQLVRELGKGGMGSVWLAHHLGLDTACALKFIHPSVAALEGTHARFAREARAVAQLRSPHVVGVLDHGEWEGQPYIAMEYLEGEDLGSWLKRQPRLSALDTATVISQVARALTKAHAAGLVHRDLKPENIFLVREEDHTLVKVLDFGIAKSTLQVQQTGNTATGALLGTPHYMSPEQAQGTKGIDHRSDLWSLAVVAFRCITGRLPFVSEALGDLLVQIIVGPLPVPTRIAPEVPPRFDVWWARAAARDPAQRFQSAKEFAEALALALNVSQVMSRSPSMAAPAGFAGGGEFGRAPGPSGATPGAAADLNPGAWQVAGGSGGSPAGGGYPAPPPLGVSGAAPLASRDGQPGATVAGLSHTFGDPRGSRIRVVASILLGTMMLGAAAVGAYVFIRPDGRKAAPAASGTTDVGVTTQEMAPERSASPPEPAVSASHAAPGPAPPRQRPGTETKATATATVKAPVSAAPPSEPIRPPVPSKPPSPPPPKSYDPGF